MATNISEIKMADDKIDHVEQGSTLQHDDAVDDKAGAVIKESGHTMTLTHENNKRVLRKIDTHVLPVILCIYLMQALDKVCALD